MRIETQSVNIIHAQACLDVGGWVQRYHPRRLGVRFGFTSSTPRAWFWELVKVGEEVSGRLRHEGIVELCDGDIGSIRG